MSKRIGMRIAAVLSIVIGLFVLGVLLTPPAPMTYAMSLPPVPPQPNASPAVRGTLASFTALIPVNTAVFLPTIVR